MPTLEQRRAQASAEQRLQPAAGQADYVAPSAPPAPQQLVATA
jgi:hypothetical protein